MRCDDAAHAWVRSCAAEQAISMSLESCPSGVAIVSVRPNGGPPLRVEVSTKPSAFLRVNDVGLSPIGDFPDWSREPETTRHAFDAVAACVRARPPTALIGDRPAEPGPRPVTAAIPWLVAAAALVALIACARTRALHRRLPRAVLAVVASAIVVFAVRRLLVPIQFFHQNGQAPLWIEFAFRGDSAGYGPGYAEIFWPFVRRAARPDLRLFFVQEVAAAFTPACAFLIARAAGARRGVAFLIAMALALDPLAMRLARSESYFATIVTLLMFSGAMLSTRAHVLLRAVGCGLLVAAAARIHPLAWVPSALLPLLSFARPGRTLRVVRETIFVTIVIALTVAITTLPAMRAVLRDDIGARFLPGALAHLRGHGLYILIAVVLAIPLLLIRRSRHVARRGLVVAIVLVAARASNAVRLDTAMINSRASTSLRGRSTTRARRLCRRVGLASTTGRRCAALPMARRHAASSSRRTFCGRSIDGHSPPSRASRGTASR